MAHTSGRALFALANRAPLNTARHSAPEQIGQPPLRPRWAHLSASPVSLKVVQATTFKPNKLGRAAKSARSFLLRRISLGWCALRYENEEAPIHRFALEQSE